MNVRLLCLILAVGFLVRLVNLWVISQTAFIEFPMVNDQTDMYAFWEWAKTILAGDWLGRNPYHPYFDWMQTVAPPEYWVRWRGGKEVFHQAPFYPYFIAGLLKLSNSLGFVLFVQILIGSLQPLIMFLLARRFFDERAGLIAAALTAVYGPFAFYQATLLRDWLIPVLESLIVLMALCARDTSRMGPWLLTGCMMAIAALTKESTLLLSLVVTLWLLFHSGWPDRQVLRLVGLLIAGFLLCVSPLLVRNALLGLTPYVISGQGAGSVFIGLLADADPVGIGQLPEDAREIALKADGRLLVLVREAMKSYHGDYGDLVLHQFLKIRGLVDAYEPPNNVSYYYGRDISPLLRFTFDYRLLWPLGLAGLLLSFKHRPAHRMLHLYALVAFMVQMVTVILSRFRLGLVPVLILGAAYLFGRAIHLCRERQWGRFTAMWCAVLLLAVIQFTWAARYDPSSTPSKYWEWADYRVAARTYASHNRFDLATSELERFRNRIRHSPDDAQVFSVATAEEGDYHIMWARELADQDRLREARLQTLAAEAVYSEQILLHYPLYNLGTMYLRLGEHETGKRFLKQFVEVEPENPQAEKARLLLDRSDHPDEPHRDVSGAEVETQ